MVIITCKGRWEHAEQALRAWRDVGEQPVLVDSLCPDGSGDRAHALGFIVVNDPEEPWCKGRASNRGLALVQQYELPGIPERAILSDADVLPTRPLPPCDDHTFFIAAPEDQAFGFVGPVPSRFRCDEQFVGWGADDLTNRLELHLRYGLTPRVLPPGTFWTLPHSDESRGLFVEGTLEQSHRRALFRLAWLYTGWTGRQLWEEPKSEAIRACLNETTTNWTAQLPAYFASE